ncbi:barstar family protein [Pseudomonas sp. PDM23]|uniref:barstar family protein n=1 Tax=unclassified Pseudomonas TaxID=196821 RepID=UPI001785C6C7|nr:MULTISPECIES: barstar family protein [unclassified Pseudomonas]MBD9576098.1 barstar family protein [Pseudomonas sp. PDM23]MBD9668957.1 barstar family protein [Pseudomonas sp. PDM21]
MTRPQIITIDLGGVRGIEELHECLGQALGFPDWYGRNWDAFWDAITGLVDMPEMLELHGWSAFAVTMPKESVLLSELFVEMNDKYPAWAPKVIYR